MCKTKRTKKLSFPLRKYVEVNDLLFGGHHSKSDYFYSITTNYPFNLSETTLLFFFFAAERVFTLFSRAKNLSEREWCMMFHQLNYYQNNIYSICFVK